MSHCASSHSHIKFNSIQFNSLSARDHQIPRAPLLLKAAHCTLVLLRLFSLSLIEKSLLGMEREEQESTNREAARGED